MKIHIFGCSGSGKTWLSGKLSAKYNLPHFDLDDLFWDSSKGGYGVKTPVEKRNQLLNDILKQENWIIEGAYYSWLPESFEKADRIIVLDIPAEICKRRVVKRFFKRKFGAEREKKESIKSLYELIKWIDLFQEENLPEALKILKPYREKTIFLTSGKEMDLCALSALSQMP